MPRTTTMTPADCEAIRAMHRNGKTFEQIAEEYGVIYDTIQYHVRGRCRHAVNVEPVPYSCPMFR